MPKKKPVKNVRDDRMPWIGFSMPPGWEVVERYPLNPPFAFAVIGKNPATSEMIYFIDEIALSKKEASKYSQLLTILELETVVPRGKVDPEQFFKEAVKGIIERYEIEILQMSMAKILYYARRDFVGFGVIDALMFDSNIEDISCDGVGLPIFVYHHKYENLATNIIFKTDEMLDNMTVRLAHLSGKHISSAFPVAQGVLPGNYRLMATYRREISKNGSTFVIRKHSEDPITIIDLIRSNTMTTKMGAYLWYIMEHRSTAIVAGTTGSGKTTMLNVLLSLLPLYYKIVTIEEVQEVNIAQPNWTALITRENYGTAGEGASEVGIFDLIKTSMRMRPDILVVGEVRGEEAYALFQGIVTGHAGAFTIHADDALAAVQRMITKPLSVPESFIPFIDIIMTVRRVGISTPRGVRYERRVYELLEVESMGTYTRMFGWDPKTDVYSSELLTKSSKINKFAKEAGISQGDAILEVGRREVVLKWLSIANIRDFKTVAKVFQDYREDPNTVYEKAKKEVGYNE